MICRTLSQHKKAGNGYHKNSWKSFIMHAKTRNTADIEMPFSPIGAKISKKLGQI